MRPLPSSTASSSASPGILSVTLSAASPTTSPALSTTSSAASVPLSIMSLISFHLFHGRLPALLHSISPPISSLTPRSPVRSQPATFRFPRPNHMPKLAQVFELANRYGADDVQFDIETKI